MEDNWLFTTEQNLINLPDRDKPLYASTYLRDVALQFYRQLTATAPITWTQFKDEFKKQFQAANYNESLLDSLDKLRQTGLVGEYIRKFMFLANQLVDTSETVKIHMFRKNLTDKIKAEIRYKKPTTLVEATNIAIEYEDSFQPKEKYDYSEVNSNDKKTKICNHCNKRGHTRSDCYRLKNQTQNNNSYAPKKNMVTSRNTNQANKGNNQTNSIPRTVF